MVAAGFAASFEFFAQACQKSLGTGAQATSSGTKQTPIKKARREAGCEVQGKLELLEKLTVVGSFAV